MQLPAPRPENLSSKLGNNESVLGLIFNTAKGVFDTVASIELQKYEAERLADIRDAEQEAKMQRQRELAGVGLPNLSGAGGFGSLTSLNQGMAIFGGILMAGAGLILLSRD
tara:strand:+ start:9100 stop:9432 length:333 start_codon:yes stop_codon:yes gene_type:complete